MFRQGYAFLRWLAILALCPLGCAGAVASGEVPPRYELTATHVWHLNAPHGERFDASGLLLRPDGELWTVSDRGPTLYRIRFRQGKKGADLVKVPGIFTHAQLKPYAAEKIGRYDCEGLTQDDTGRIYMCEEANRWILRYDPRTKTVKRLDIDWTPVRKFFNPKDRNASFEGVAYGDGRLYVANEREWGQIIVVDPRTWQVADNFNVHAADSIWPDTHYSDLCWYDGALFALLREDRCILQIEPKSHRVLAEFHYANAERGSDFAYEGFFGVMEGLALDRDGIWLVTDNNGEPRRSDHKDRRPSLVRFAWPK